MSFLKTKGFKYVKNLIIGIGASVVLLGALFKLESWPYATEMLTAGLLTEAFIFAFLGIVGPEKDYYWEKLYPGLDNYRASLTPLTDGPAEEGGIRPLDSVVVDQRLEGMLSELQVMSKSMSSLKALQEVDFSGTSDQIRAMGNFYSKLNEAMANLSDSAEDAKVYKDQLVQLNKNIGSLNNTYGKLNNVYGNVISAMGEASKS